MSSRSLKSRRKPGLQEDLSSALTEAAAAFPMGDAVAAGEEAMMFLPFPTLVSPGGTAAAVKETGKPQGMAAKGWVRSPNMFLCKKWYAKYKGWPGKQP